MSHSHEQLSRESEPNLDQVTLEHVLEQAGFRVGQKIQLPESRKKEHARDIGTVGVITKSVFIDHHGRRIPALEVMYHKSRYDKTGYVDVIPLHQLYDLNPVLPKSEAQAVSINERLALSAFQPMSRSGDYPYSIMVGTRHEEIAVMAKELIAAVAGTTPEDVKQHPDSYRAYALHLRHMIDDCDMRVGEHASDASRRGSSDYYAGYVTEIRMWQLQLEDIYAKLQTLLPDKA